MVITEWMVRHAVMVPALLENSQLIFEEEELKGNPVFVILGDYTAGESGPVGLVLDASYRVLYMVKGAGHALKAGSEEELGKRIVVITEGLPQGQ